MNIFFYGYNSLTIWAWLALVAGLVIANEIARRYKYAGIFTFVVLPVCLTIWWAISASHKGGPIVPSSGNVFGWIKTYSALAGCIGFMFIRYGKGKIARSKWILIFPAFILAFNILEAVFYDFYNYARFLQYAQNANMLDGRNVFGYLDTNSDLIYRSGPWNIMNGIAGLLNMITISGWFGIKVSKKKSKDMIWSDQLWFWIIAYDVWNVAYCYNNISNRSMYAGVALILSCTIAEFFIQKGAWLQHRAQTLAIFAMFSLSVPYEKYDAFKIHGTNNAKALTLLSALALVINILVAIYAIYRITKKKLNPLKDELYTDLKAYKENLAFVEVEKQF